MDAQMDKKTNTKDKSEVIIERLKKNITTLKMVNDYYLTLYSTGPNGGLYADVTRNHRNATDDVIDDLIQILFNVMDNDEEEFLIHEYDRVSTDVAQL